MSKLIPTSVLNGFSQEFTGLTIKETTMGELVSLSCPLDQQAAFEDAFKKAYSAPLPAPSHYVKTKTGLALWTGQDQYMLMSAGENINADTQAVTDMNGHAYATLQTDGWASVEVSGEHLYTVLERLIALDLRRAPDDFAARTSAHHISVIIIKHAKNRLQLLTPRSSARAFLEGLLAVSEGVLS